MIQVKVCDIFSLHKSEIKPGGCWWWCLAVSDSFVTPWTVAYQAPLSMGFSRQESWSGLPFPSSGDLPHPGTESASLALAGDSLPLSQQGGPKPGLLLHKEASHENELACGKGSLTTWQLYQLMSVCCHYSSRFPVFPISILGL